MNLTSKHKTIFSYFFILSLLTSTGALAVWSTTVDTDFEMSVGSTGTAKITFTIPFGNMDVDTTSGTQTISQKATLHNPLTTEDYLNFTYDYTIEDISGDGCTYNDDCTWEFRKGSVVGTLISNGSEIYIDGGKYFEIYWSAVCEPMSCPAKIDFNVSIV